MKPNKSPQSTLSKDEFVYVNERRADYMDLIMDKHPGSALREKRQALFAKLNEWRDVSYDLYNSQTPRTFIHATRSFTSENAEDTWVLQRL